MLTNRIGQVYGRLTVIERTVCPKRFASPTYQDRTWWMCLCECGRKHPAAAPLLRNGVVKSCGCLRREHAKRAVAEIHARKGFRLWTDEEVSALQEAKERGDTIFVIAERLGRTPSMVSNKWARIQADSLRNRTANATNEKDATRAS